MSGYILNGVYHKGRPDLGAFKDGINSQYREWDHDAQRREHRIDLIQPYKEGKPNPEFIDNYKEESIQYGFIKGD